MSLKRHSSIERLRKEFKELVNDPADDFVAGPVRENNLFLWHFTIKGAPDSPFEGGIYHGELIFPGSYPMEPPDIVFLTPNGRWKTGVKVCLTTTSYHREEWAAAWDVRSILTSIIAFMVTPGEGAIGAIDAPASERRRLAELSRNWKCDQCGLTIEPDPLRQSTQEGKVDEDVPSDDMEEEQQMMTTFVFKWDMIKDYQPSRLRFLWYFDVPIFVLVLLIIVIVSQDMSY